MAAPPVVARAFLGVSPLGQTLSDANGVTVACAGLLVRRRAEGTFSRCSSLQLAVSEVCTSAAEVSLGGDVLGGLASCGGDPGSGGDDAGRGGNRDPGKSRGADIGDFNVGGGTELSSTVCSIGIGRGEEESETLYAEDGAIRGGCQYSWELCEARWDTGTRGVAPCCQTAPGAKGDVPGVAFRCAGTVEWRQSLSCPEGGGLCHLELRGELSREVVVFARADERDGRAS